MLINTELWFVLCYHRQGNSSGLNLLEDISMVTIGFSGKLSVITLELGLNFV